MLPHITQINKYHSVHRPHLGAAQGIQQPAPASLSSTMKPTLCLATSACSWLLPGRGPQPPVTCRLRLLIHRAPPCHMATASADALAHLALSQQLRVLALQSNKAQTSTVLAWSGGSEPRREGPLPQADLLTAPAAAFKSLATMQVMQQCLLSACLKNCLNRAS